jgi:hypothetical protein
LYNLFTIIKYNFVILTFYVFFLKKKTVRSANQLVKQYWKKEDAKMKESLFKRKEIDLSSEEEIERNSNHNGDESLKYKKSDNDRYNEEKITSPSPHRRINRDHSAHIFAKNSEPYPDKKKTRSTISSNKGKQKEKEVSTTLKSARSQSTSIVDQTQQLYPPPIFLQRIKPFGTKELLDPEIRDPKESLDWDEDSINIEFLELDDQGKIVGYLNW